MSGIEIYGYVSMIVVVASCLMNDVMKLRVGNLIGCVMFVVYGVLMDAMPVVIMNLIIIVIHAYHIWKIKNK